jgi:hypothetical protein
MHEQISDRELDYLIDQWSSKYYRHTGSTAPIVSALRELKLRRAQVGLLKTVREGQSEEIADLKARDK